MGKSCEFIGNVNIGDIPWNRLATTYGRGTDFPAWLSGFSRSDTDDIDAAGEQIALNTEHQSTLWPATPFMMVFLARVLADSLSDMTNVANRYRVEHYLLDLFTEVAEACKMGEEIEHVRPLPYFEDMLSEEYLWSIEYDEEEDVGRYEDDPFPDKLFYSFYFYSGEVLRFWKDELRGHIDTDDKETADRILRLVSLID